MTFVAIHPSPFERGFLHSRNLADLFLHRRSVTKRKPHNLVAECKNWRLLCLAYLR
jgi:hypothetical protein